MEAAIIDSVEIMVDAPWVFSTPFPRKTTGNRIANLDNVLYHIGGYGSQMYKWEANSNEWTYLDYIINPRLSHALSVITVDVSILDFCHLFWKITCISTIKKIYHKHSITFCCLRDSKLSINVTL